MSPEPKQKPGRSKQDYGTPPEFLAAVKSLIGVTEFDCDLAASHENAVCVPYCSEGDDDAFKQSHWRIGSGWNWLNPPYSKIGRWVERAQLESANGAKTAVLIPAAVGSNWWRDHVNHKCEVFFLNPRLTFVGCKDPYPKDCALLLYSPLGCHPYDVWTWKQGRTHPAIVKSGDVSLPIGSAS